MGNNFKPKPKQSTLPRTQRLIRINLNPLRAGIVKRLEDYRWNSIGYHIQTNNRD
jgi:hypothetical protein